MKNLTKLNRRSGIIFPELDKYNLPKLMKKIYANRGISSISEINLNINNILSYSLLKNIDKAVNILIKYLFQKKKIIIVGDFDTDGVTSTALLMIALKEMGFNNINFIIPNRFKDGHGLNEEIVEKIYNIKGEIIITVDNGITSYKGIDLAIKKNMIVIITDHHIPIFPLPNANVIINPNLKDCKFPSKSISGVGIAFYLMKALNDKLININWFKKSNINIPNIYNLLDLVAIGTIADMSYLDLNNRILINEGINQIKLKQCRLGILVLINFLNIDIKNISTSDISFYIIPRINSAGRLKDMSICMKLLLTSSLEEALYISKELDLLNSIRKKIVKNMELESTKLCDEYIKKYKNNNFLIIYDSKWHIGMIGIIASKIKNKFQKPVIIFSKLKNNKLIGSGRSIEECNMYEIINKINNLNPNLILKFGGHSMAVGLVIELEKLNLFKTLFKKELKIKINKDYNKIIWSDGELLENEITLINAKIINENGPWGLGFPDPIFDGKFNLINKKIFNENNLKITVKSIHGKSLIEGIIFNIDNNFWDNLKSKELILAYKLYISKYKNKFNLKILIEHAWVNN